MFEKPLMKLGLFLIIALMLTISVRLLPISFAQNGSDELAVGTTVTITGLGDTPLEIKAKPSISAETRFSANNGEVYIIVAGPETADGFVWWQIRDPDNVFRLGWVLADYLAVGEIISPTPTETLPPTATNTATFTVTPTFTPTPEPAGISLQTAGELTRLARLGGGAISDVVLNPANDQLLVATRVGIWVYSYPDLEFIGAIDNIESYVGSILFSPDGSQLVYSGENTVHLLDTTTNTEISSIDIDPNSLAMYFNSGANQLITSGGQVWNINSGQYDGDLVENYGVDDISADWRYVVSHNKDGGIILIHAQTGAGIRELRGHENEVNDVTFSPNGQILASTSDDQTLRLWSVSSGASQQVIELESTPTIVEFSPSGQMLAVVVGNTMRLFDASSGAELRTLQAVGHLLDIMFTADGGHIISRDSRPALYVWDATTGDMIQEKSLQGYNDEIVDLSLDTVNNLAFAVSDDNSLHVWSLPYRSASSLLQGQTAELVAVFSGNEGQLLATSDGSETIQIWDIASGSEVDSLFARTDAVRFLLSNPDQPYLLVGGADYVVGVFDMMSGDDIALEGHAERLTALALSSDGRFVASSDRDGQVIVWNRQTGDRLQNLVVEIEGTNTTEYARSLAFNPDASVLAIGLSNGMIFLLDTQNGSQIASLAEHSDAVTALAFSTDGSLLISGSYDRSLRVWDIETGEVLRLLEDHNDTITEVAFSDDGTLLITASEDGTLMLWGVYTAPTAVTENVVLQLAIVGVNTNSEWQPYSQVFDGIEMVLVPAGCFMMGSEDGHRNESPSHEQCFDEPFWIDRTEVTQADFERLDGQKFTNDSTASESPVSQIQWIEARAFCELRQMRLPTEREWEYAARGPDSLSYPWGNDFVADNVVFENTQPEQPTEVGSRPGGVSWVGALGLSGNVAEWTNSRFDQHFFPYPYNWP